MGTRLRSPLVGRSAELDVVRSAIDGAAAGMCRVVVLEGEPGIGKTRILEEAEAGARTRGFVVFAGTALELEETRPFGAVMDALRVAEQSSFVARFRQRLDDPSSSELQVVDAFVDLLEHHGADRPVALVLDDVHWADPATLLVLRSAARRLRTMPVLLVVALRPVPVSPQLRRVVDVLIGEGAQHLVIPPLADGEVVALVAASVAAEPGAALLDEVRGAHGNPFFVVELATTLMEEGVVAVADGRADVVTRTMPPRLRMTVLRRLGFLPRETLDVLRDACVLGPTFSVHDVAVVTGRELRDLNRALEPAIDAGVVGEHDELLAFRHDLVHDALYRDRPLAIRKGLHRIAGQRLAASGAPAGRVAVQLALGADEGDAEALEWLDRAVEQTRTRSVGASIALARRGLALSLPGSMEQARFASLLCSLLYWSGAMDEVESFARPLVGHLARRRWEVRFMLGAAVEASGRVREAIEHLELAAADPDVEPDVRPVFLAELALRHARVGDLDGAERLALQARSDAARERMPPVAAAEMALAQVAGARGLVHDAEEIAAGAVIAAAANWHGTTFGYPFARLTHGWSLVDADRLDEAEDVLREGRQAADARGVVAQVPLYDGALAITYWLAGRRDDALVEAESGLDLVDELGTRRGALLMRAAQSLALLHAGDVGGAAASAAAGEREVAGREPEFGGDWLMWAHGMTREAAGDAQGALASLRTAWRISAPLRYFVVWRSVAPVLVRLAVSLGERKLAVDVTAEVVDGAARAPGVATAAGAGLRCQGLLEDEPELLGRAVEAYRDGPRPLETAAASEDAGRGYERCGARSSAVPFFRDALERYERAGATRDASRVRAHLRATGVRVATSTAQRRPVSGWESLTAAELGVVRLAAEGLSNPEIADRLFISRRTVQTHLSHVFRKLGVRSRAHLIVEVSTRARSSVPGR